MLGYLPGVALAWALYAFTVKATDPTHEDHGRTRHPDLRLTVVMCSLSGLLAMRKLRKADPADVF